MTAAILAFAIWCALSIPTALALGLLAGAAEESR